MVLYVHQDEGNDEKKAVRLGQEEEEDEGNGDGDGMEIRRNKRRQGRCRNNMKGEEAKRE
jgi:hypothetical protein